MKPPFSLFVIVIFCCSFVKQNSDYLNWEPNRHLSFSDFKGTAPSNISSKSAVNSSISISYQISQIPGKTPEVIIFNKFDRSGSWIKLKTREILDLQQIHFDYSELYARKIRKEIMVLKHKKVTEKEKYIYTITKFANRLNKLKNKENALLYDQPHLIKIMKKDVSDSLKLYADYTK